MNYQQFYNTPLHNQHTAVRVDPFSNVAYNAQYVQQLPANYNNALQSTYNYQRTQTNQLQFHQNQNQNQSHNQHVSMNAMQTSNPPHFQQQTGHYNTNNAWPQQQQQPQPQQQQQQTSYDYQSAQSTSNYPPRPFALQSTQNTNNYQAFTHSNSDRSHILSAHSGGNQQLFHNNLSQKNANYANGIYRAPLHHNNLSNTNSHRHSQTASMPNINSTAVASYNHSNQTNTNTNHVSFKPFQTTTSKPMAARQPQPPSFTRLMATNPSTSSSSSSSALSVNSHSNRLLTTNHHHYSHSNNSSNSNMNTNSNVQYQAQSRPRRPPPPPSSTIISSGSSSSSTISSVHVMHARPTIATLSGVAPHQRARIPAQKDVDPQQLNNVRFLQFPEASTRETREPSRSPQFNQAAAAAVAEPHLFSYDYGAPGSKGSIWTPPNFTCLPLTMSPHPFQAENSSPAPFSYSRCNELLCEQLFVVRSFLKDKVVLEVGCGFAIPSVFALQHGARFAFATDGNDDIVNVLPEIMQTNKIAPNQYCAQRLTLNRVEDIRDVLKTCNQQLNASNVDIMIAVEVWNTAEDAHNLLQTIAYFFGCYEDAQKKRFRRMKQKEEQEKQSTPTVQTHFSVLLGEPRDLNRPITNGGFLPCSIRPKCNESNHSKIASPLFSPAQQPQQDTPMSEDGQSSPSTLVSNQQNKNIQIGETLRSEAAEEDKQYKAPFVHCGVSSTPAIRSVSDPKMTLNVSRFRNEEYHHFNLMNKRNQQQGPTALRIPEYQPNDRNVAVDVDEDEDEDDDLLDIMAPVVDDNHNHNQKKRTFQQMDDNDSVPEFAQLDDSNMNLGNLSNIDLTGDDSHTQHNKKRRVKKGVDVMEEKEEQVYVHKHTVSNAPLVFVAHSVETAEKKAIWDGFERSAFTKGWRITHLKKDRCLEVCLIHAYRE